MPNTEIQALRERRALADFGPFTGLSDVTARERLAADGPNELPAGKARGVARIALEVAWQPMFMLLVAAGTLYLLMGKPGDALVLLGFVFIVMGITIVQERRTERALDALRDLSSPRALVVRQGRRQRIAGRDVVSGDILLLNEGDRVSADAILRRCSNLSVDESLLTGEAVPVRKTPSGSAHQLERPGGDDLPSVFAGTLVTSGQGIAEVVATGVRTELGKIGKALQKIEPEPTPLQRETGRFVRILASVGLGACAAAAVGYGLTRGGSWQVWKDGLLAGLAMAMAILPEEFPVILTVFLALGAWRISRSRVLTRRLPVIETLGAATVLCVDKTGTLTLNQMTLRVVATEVAAVEADESLRTAGNGLAEVLQAAVLASKPDPFDPMERALHEARDRLVPEARDACRDWEMIREYPLTPELLAVSHVWRRGAENPVVVVSKGAPEAIAELCRLAPDRRAHLRTQVQQLASRGLRVLGVARSEIPARELPAQQAQLAQELMGLVAFEDPLRQSVPAAVAECRSAGIRVIMITGDYPETACSIARQAGLSRPESVMSGEELERTSDTELARRIRETQVFARVVPEQKLRIVMALKANSEVVAMTGDGVNDAPALKAAHIGIAMGGRGTDVAREAASLVLLDDDFSSIVATVKLGRRIYDNIRKAISFTVAVHVPIAGLSIAPVLLPGWPLLLLPVHIAFLELIIDPSCSLIFEAEQAEADIMSRHPRGAAERLFSARTVGPAVLQGLSALAVCLAIVSLARPGHGPDAARALSFAALVVSFLTIILVNRSWTRSALSMMRAPNPALWWVLPGAAVFLGGILTIPALQRLFSFSPLHAADLTASLIAGFLCLMWFELLKRFAPSRQR
ncbi:MAG TPA: cation-translocating P-type ATPase [Steroidobacteraceae bacterium]|nr:cation-translocating P-type ATPase [Steroidobacteraceae bacterium]